MSMKPREAVACPACEAPNRPTWEFCVRCGESLEGAPPQDEGTGTARMVLRPADEGTSSATSTGVALLFVLALSALAVGAWVGPSRAGPERPDPAMFTIGTLPSPLPSPPAPAPDSGVEDYVEGRRLLGSGQQGRHSRTGCNGENEAAPIRLGQKRLRQVCHFRTRVDSMDTPACLPRVKTAATGAGFSSMTSVIALTYEPRRCGFSARIVIGTNAASCAR